MIHHLNVDIETFSLEPIAKTGLYKYARAKGFQIILFGFSLDDAAPVVLDLAQGEKLPAWLRTALFAPETIKHAYNASFEWYCLSQYYGLPDPCMWLPQWRDTMLHAAYLGYPGSLDAVGRAMGLPEDKRKLTTGKALIKTFCVPRTPTDRDRRTRIRPADEPEKWELFKTYNAGDVVAEQEIERRLSAVAAVPDTLQHQWETDLRINSRGVALDLDLIRGALDCAETVTAALTDEAVKLTGLDNPNSVAQLSGWIAAETGEEVADLRKDTVKTMLGRDLDSDTARRVLEIRQELSKTSNKKYTAMTDAVCADGRVRGLLQFYGANRTGRWAGRIIQPQNLPQTHLHGGMLNLARELVKGRKIPALRMIYGSVPDTLSQLIRTALVPAPGHIFIDADFSAIEARVIAWLAGEDWVLDVFRSHGKIYEATASQMFGVPIDKIVKGQPEYALRQRGKVATLALGYQGGPPAMIKLDKDHVLKEDELPEIVHRWRDANPNIVRLWHTVERAAVSVIQTGRPAGVRGLMIALKGDQETDQLFLTIRLPSGRKLYYARPFVAPGKFGDQMFYWGMNQTSHKWEATDTYGGKLVENCVQAIARDCLAENIERLEAAGYPVVFHVHDECVIDKAPAGKPEDELAAVCGIMSQPILWAPGLPLKADGWVGEYYTKD